MTRSRRVLVLAAFVLSACSSRMVEVPPRVGLSPYGRVGLVTFETATARNGLGHYATQRFLEEVLTAQPGIEILEIGDGDSLLAAAGEADFGPAFARKVGEAHGVPAVFVGRLEVTSLRPGGTLESLRNLDVGAEVSAELQARLLSTQSGGTLWRGSAAATEKVGGITVVSGRPSIAARDPNDAYGAMVHRLVNDATWDLKPSWRRE
jgi:hypothetical protein